MADAAPATSIPGADGRNDRVRAITLRIGLAIASFAALGSLTWPLASDHGMFTWVGDVILGGGMPYRDAWEMKGPLSYYLSALATWMFGTHEYSIRIIDLILVSTAAAFVHRFVWRLSEGRSRTGAGCAAVFVLLAYFGLGYSCTSQPEGWSSLLILACAFILIDQQRSFRAMTLAGICVATAALFKPTFLVFIVLPLSAAASSENRPRLLPMLACAGFGLFVPMAVTLAYFDLRGALPDLIETNRFLATTYAPLAERNPLALAKAFIAGLLHLGLLIPLAIAPVGLRTLHQRGERTASRVVGAWLLLSLLLVIGQGRFWIYHWLPAIIALSVTTGLSLDAMSAFRWRDQRVRQYGPILISVLLPALLVIPAARSLFHAYEWPLVALHIESRDQYFQSVSTQSNGSNYLFVVRAARFVEAHTAPSDRVLSWSMNPAINYLAKRASPTRFGYPYPVLVAGPMRAHYRELFMREMQQNRPRLIVIDTSSKWSLLAPSGLELLDQFQDFARLFHGSYVLTTVIGDLQIYSLLERNAAGRS